MQLFGFPSINKDGSSATKMEFYQKPESQQTQNSSSELKTLEPTIEGKRPRKQSITSKSNENNCPEIDIKQEIPSFDDDYTLSVLRIIVYSVSCHFIMCNSFFM